MVTMHLSAEVLPEYAGDYLILSKYSDAGYIHSKKQKRIKTFLLLKTIMYLK